VPFAIVRDTPVFVVDHEYGMTAKFVQVAISYLYPEIPDHVPLNMSLPDREKSILPSPITDHDAGDSKLIVGAILSYMKSHSLVVVEFQALSIALTLHVYV